MADIKFVDNHIEIDKVPKKPKRLTATRFATVMGLNAWQTPFEAWCAITKTYEDPFEDTIYTIAGKVIEPKIIDYLNRTYFMDVKSPEDIYGQDYFKKTWGNFFPNEEFFGGMWDALGDDFVVEIKTTKRAEDWQNDIPIYYKLQAALYAYLLGFDNVIVTATFLEDNDYVQPELFEPNHTNTVMFEFSMAEAFPNFEEDYIYPASQFWHKHVMTGISPDYDEKKDAEILKVLRTNNLAPEDDEVAELLKEAENLKAEIELIDEKAKPLTDRLKEVQDALKRYMTEQFRDGDTKVELTGQRYSWTLSKSVRKSVDSKKLKDDGLFDQYAKESESYTLRQTAIE
ncbi:YqaJ viral recombinase family protein [Jeotgalibaca porci]|uniref:YqaJ viral recombinase family protein n=1 Tax=Jeotgalibaca porci TaxID=1868793 RepID=UPI0035A07870